ncbi:unnamed protein product [Linum tenue]|uniref:RING-CH-type domain-containing protein n=1 Tax=Linum tenue TaxID=586396 RepID=A0AAV0HV28_9ROSI|nr:unnamed protein product [Linum tenue]
MVDEEWISQADRLSTESAFEAALNSSTDFLCHIMELDYRLPTKKLVDCRICHDEDEDTSMEVPCSCSGSLKYAHRKCVQRWCNEKGDTTCEICQQQFKPGYTAPAPLFHYGGNWEMSGNDFHNHQFIAMVTDDRDFLDSDFDDYTTTPSPTSLMCCRVVAIIFMVLLVLRHTLPIITTRTEDYSVTLFTLSLLRTIGILLPIYVMVKVFAAVQRQRQLVSHMAFMPSSDEESELPQVEAQSRLEPQSRLIRVQ